MLQLLITITWSVLSVGSIGLFLLSIQKLYSARHTTKSHGARKAWRDYFFGAIGGASISILNLVAFGISLILPESILPTTFGTIAVFTIPIILFIGGLYLYKRVSNGT